MFVVMSVSYSIKWQVRPKYTTNVICSCFIALMAHLTHPILSFLANPIPPPPPITIITIIIILLTDNELEYFIRQDNYELTMSSVVRTSSLTTWIYFDHRNFLGTNEDIDQPLQNVYNSDGSTITGTKTTLSQYLRWDHSLQKMVVDQTLPSEQNGDAPLTVYNFLVTALADCVSKGSTEYFVAFASDGGGFDGFGGDENTGRRLNRRPRQLTIANSALLNAMKTALAAVPGAPDKFDVLGFDACLMQAVGAADEYRDIAHYYLASEAVEPGHGELTKMEYVLSI